ncbi:MAG: ABC transporter ATP-binding protein [Pseudomonadota bacterium]
MIRNHRLIFPVLMGLLIATVLVSLSIGRYPVSPEAIGRFLAQGADTLIMDEPANSLDFGNQIRLLDEIRKLAQEGYTFVKSTHFPDHALWIADRVIMLQHGAIIADGSPDDIMNDESICNLYNTRITIIRIDDSVRTCIPRSILGLSA